MEREKTIRRQLTLFADAREAEGIEAFRREFNPIQQALIAAHVTLCREEELVDWPFVMNQLSNQPLRVFNLYFQSPERFDNGRGLFLPAREPLQGFHQLRRSILPFWAVPIHQPHPHLTLIHPRNAVCTDEIFEAASKIRFPDKLTFSSITLIEQENAGVWKRLTEFNLLTE